MHIHHIQHTLQGMGIQHKHVCIQDQHIHTHHRGERDQPQPLAQHQQTSFQGSVHICRESRQSIHIRYKDNQHRQSSQVLCIHHSQDQCIHRHHKEEQGQPQPQAQHQQTSCQGSV